MSFTLGFWLAGLAGALTGVAAAGLEARNGARALRRRDGFPGGFAGAGTAVIAFAMLALLEGMFSIMRGRASATIPLLFTIAGCALTLLSIVAVHRVRRVMR